MVESKLFVKKQQFIHKENCGRHILSYWKMKNIEVENIGYESYYKKVICIVVLYLNRITVKESQYFFGGMLTLSKKENMLEDR